MVWYLVLDVSSIAVVMLYGNLVVVVVGCHESSGIVTETIRDDVVSPPCSVAA